MKNLQRNIVVLIAAGCFVCCGLSRTAQAQTKTAKTQKSTAEQSAVKSAAKPVTKTEPKSAVKTSKPTDTKKPTQKNQDKPKTAAATKASAEKPEKKKSTQAKDAGNAAANNTRNQSEKNSRENTAKEKTVQKTARSNQKPVAKTVAAVTKPARKDSTVKPAKTVALLTASEKPAWKNVESAQLIVAATSARVRAEPNANADTVSTVDFGKILTVSDQNAAWFKVRLAGDKSGWVSRSIVADFDDARRAETYRKILDKYFKGNKLDFAEAAQIFDFLKNASTQVKETDDKADLSFKRLVALRAALDAIPFGKSAQEPYKNFLAANEKETVYSEPSAEWLVRSDLIWETHARYKDLPVGEEIAWIGAQNPLPGECEGYVNCYLYLLRVTDGEYLNFYPNGKYSKKAVQNIAATLEPITADLKNRAIYTAAIDISDRAEFNRLLTELRTIISKAPHVEKAETIKQINQIGEGFR